MPISPSPPRGRKTNSSWGEAISNLVTPASEPAYIVLQMRKIKVARINELHSRGAFELEASEAVEPVEQALLLAGGKTKGHLLADAGGALQPQPPHRSEPVPFEEQPRDLGAVEQQVVGPFQGQARSAQARRRLDGFVQGEPGHEPELRRSRQLAGIDQK